MNTPVIVLKKGRERSVQRFHPWIFSGAIQRELGNPQEGDVVRVVASGDQFLGLAHYAKASLAAKILSYEDETIDAAWFEGRLSQALNFRKELGLPNRETDCYRLVHGEGDLLPGLIVDIYDQVAVVQPHSAGMQRSVEVIATSLESIGFSNVLLKPTDKSSVRVLRGEVRERILVRESGIKYHIDMLGGQKTGFFLDQRENRSLVEQFAKGKRVLNVFSYTGGFSMAALRAGAMDVLSVDASADALSLAEENASLNGCDAHRTLKVDAVKYLEALNEKFDLIILDPPAFAKHKSARHNAIQAYRRINQAAIAQLQRGGILFTFSCSQVIDRDLFKGAVESAAIQAGKKVQILQECRQPSDHPVLLSHPEGAYLKGLVLRVV